MKGCVFMLDLEELKIFSAVANYENFSIAARELYLSQATISTRIKSLEAQLGLILFTRNRSKVEITSAGRLLLRYAQQLLSLAQEAEHTLLCFKTGKQGLLSFAASHTLYNWILPDIIRRFRQKNPDIEVMMNTAFSGETIRMVANGEVQFGFIRTPSSFFSDERFCSKLLEKDNTCFFASPKHHIFRNKHLTLEKLAHEPLVVYGSSTSYWPQIKSVFAQAGLSPKVAFELNDIQAVKWMVELGSGIGYLPEIALKSELGNGTFRILAMEDCPPIERYSFLIYLKNSVHAGVMKEFIEFIESLNLSVS